MTAFAYALAFFWLPIPTGFASTKLGVLICCVLRQAWPE